MMQYGYSRYVLLLAADGSLWTFGEEYLGWPVLGLSNTNIQHTTAIRRIGHDADWASLAAGDSQCLAIKTNGTLWAWGANYAGQLGDGTKSRGRPRCPPWPAPIGNRRRAAGPAVSP